ncbi:hypothetical protein RND81_02G016400 [Saponaria officinalis]|uniref:KIB1-4 beta-propeller domain-containing protein n=1 Tax=Saponaria officinalis TaxID=3572 RepID=A0AAW1MQE7_SAPOF
MSQRKVSWSNLPEELLSPIAHRLESRLDILHFRAVCKEWRNSVSLSLLSNKNILSTVLPHKLTTTNPPLLRRGAYRRREEFPENLINDSLILSASSIFLIKPTFNNAELSPWLITVEEMNSGKFVVRKPLSRSTVRKMPEYFPKMLDLSDFDVEEMGRVYSLRYDVEPYLLFEEQHKVLLLGDFDCKIRVSIDDYTAVVLYDSGVLAAINLKNAVEKEADLNRRKFDDIVMFEGTIYTIDRHGRLFLMDNSGDKLKMVAVVDEVLHSGMERKCRIFELCGELYLVRNCLVSKPSLTRKRMGVRVYKLNREKNTWDELDSIGDDRILFVIPGCCFFARATDFPGWKGNLIVLDDRLSFPCHSHTPLLGHDWEYFEFIAVREAEKKMSLEIFHFEECVFEPVETNPDYSIVFWPPPKWISANTRSLERLKSEEMAQNENTKGKIVAESGGLEKMFGNQSPIIIDIDSFPDIIPEASENVSAQETFQGVTVCAKLVPVLDKIWKKYGNVIQGHAVSSNSLLTWALESLAKMVMILQTNTSESLSDSQAAFLRTTLKDLRHFHVQLDWLVPCLDTVLVPENS